MVKSPLEYTRRRVRFATSASLSHHSRDLLRIHVIAFLLDFVAEEEISSLLPEAFKAQKKMIGQSKIEERKELRRSPLLG